MNKIISYFSEVKTETKKVSWPSREDAIRYTLIVIGASAVVAVFLGSLDLIFTKIVDKILL